MTDIPDRILALLAGGVWMTHKEIAQRLDCSTYTIERHVKGLLWSGSVEARSAYVPQGCSGRKPHEFTASQSTTGRPRAR